MAAKNRKAIGIDVDGVLADFLQQARKDLNMLFGKPSDDMVQIRWGFDSLGITKEEEIQFWKRVDLFPNWWLQLQKMPATYMLSQLCRSHRVIFITNRKDGTGYPIEIQTQMWLTRHFGIDDPVVVLSDNKGPVAAGLKLDYFIDDRPKSVTEVAESAPTCQTALLRTQYNTDLETYQGGPILETDNFDEFAKIVLAGELVEA